MEHKERFRRVYQFKDVDRVPDYEFGYWSETIDRWHSEGLPFVKKTHRDIELHLGLEGWESVEKLPIRSGLWPTLPERVLEEREGRAIVDDGMGGIFVRTTETSAPPHYTRHPLRDRDDWERLKPFFHPDTPGRLPLNWAEVAEQYEAREYPVGITMGSLYGWLRNWMGVERLSIAFYRDPEWIEEMMDTLTDLWITIIRRTLTTVQVDFATWWEDMCYNWGPLLSVRHFEDFMVPRYKRVTDVLKEYGVHVNILDCDGDISLLVPGWLEAGINCMFPIEVRYTDIYQLRERFGPRVLLMGGVNKLALIAGQEAIDTELKRLTPLLKEGGYIPTVDHRCPPEVSFSTYRYYLQKKREWIGRNEA